MTDLQFIDNQYDNKLKCLSWNAETIKKFIYFIKNPKIIFEKDKIPQWKFCNVSNPVRKTENMLSTDVLILDFDDNNYSINNFEINFREFHYILHTSYSYDTIKQKFRVFLFLNQIYDIQRLFFKTSVKAFSPYHYFIKYFPTADKASFIKCQFFKMPAIKEKGAPYYYKFNKGKLFDPFKELGFEFKLAYDMCFEKQAEHLEKVRKQAEAYRRIHGTVNLDRAKKYIDEKLENAPDGSRHNTVFGLAAWFKKIGGTYAEFSQMMTSWADSAYNKQMNRLEIEWDKL